MNSNSLVIKQKQKQKKYITTNFQVMTNRETNQFCRDTRTELSKKNSET